MPWKAGLTLLEAWLQALHAPEVLDAASLASYRAALPRAHRGAHARRH